MRSPPEPPANRGALARSTRRHSRRRHAAHTSTQKHTLFCPRQPSHVVRQGQSRGENKIGANAIHSLFIANSSASILLALELSREEPELVTLPWGTGPFEGENCLHVLAVGRREKTFLRVLEFTGFAVQQGKLGKEVSPERSAPPLARLA